MKISLHQPNYIPGLIFFHKMAMSDVLVLYDDTKYPKKDFTNRNKIKMPKGEHWLTIPLKHPVECNINEVKVLDSDWKEKHWQTIVVNYSKTPYFELYKKDFEEVYKADYTHLLWFNYALLKLIAEKLDIRATMVMSSDLYTQGHGLDKIFNTISALKADTYITGWGAGSQRYIKESEFIDRNIKLIKQEFKHPIYCQQWGREFIPNLSVLDYLFNRGGEHFYEDCNIS